MKPPANLAKYVPVQLPPARTERVWARVNAQMAPPRRLWAWAWAPALAGTVLVAWFALRSPSLGAPPAPGQSWETAQAAAEVSWGHGSSLTVAPATQVSVADQGTTDGPRRLRLAQGRLELAVSSEDGAWRVEAADTVVDASEGDFFVEFSPGRGVVVGVMRGAVWLRRGATAPAERVVEGQRVQFSPPTAMAPPSVSESAPPAPAPEEAAASAPVRPPTSVSPEPAAQASGASLKENLGPSPAKLLWDAAGEARRAGDAARAAELYAKLLAEHSSDGRAGLAAFELGRLRMDRLGDMPGAVLALQRAVSQSAGASFREDAMARLVRAYRASGATAKCERTRAAYMRDYPNGVHWSSIQRACK